MLLLPGGPRAHSIAKADRTVLVRGTDIMEEFRAGRSAGPS